MTAREVGNSWFPAVFLKDFKSNRNRFSYTVSSYRNLPNILGMTVQIHDQLRRLLPRHAAGTHKSLLGY